MDMNEARKRWPKEEEKAKLAWGMQQAESLWKGLYARFNPTVRNQVVLDFGCSWGYFCKYLLDNHRPRQVIGVDVSPLWESHEHGWDWRGEQDRLRFFAGDVTQMECIPDGSVDLITCTSVLQYLRPEQLVAALNKLYGFLRPGGEMICRTRTFTSYIGSDLHKDFSVPYVHMLYPRRNIDEFLKAEHGKEPRYLNPLTATTYLVMAHQAGFEIADAVRRPNWVDPEVMGKLRKMYPFISEDELLCAELEMRLVRPYEPHELHRIGKSGWSGGVGA